MKNEWSKIIYKHITKKNDVILTQYGNGYMLEVFDKKGILVNENFTITR